jgi:hypothetical protein
VSNIDKRLTFRKMRAIRARKSIIFHNIFSSLNSNCTLILLTILIISITRQLELFNHNSLAVYKIGDDEIFLI